MKYRILRSRIYIGSSLCLLLLTAILTGCRKNNHDDVKPPPARRELITTGHFFDQAKGYYVPVFWERAKMSTLTVIDQRSAYPYGIAQHGNDIIIAGAYESEDRLQTFPSYWKNGTMVKLPFETFVPFENCVAKDVLIWNNKLYILGAVDLRPVLWIIESNKVQKQVEIDKAYGTRSASNIHLYNNELYIGGDKELEKNGALNYSIGFWKLNGAGEGTWNEIEKDMKYATAFYLHTVSGQIYISGERNVLNNNTLDSYMTLWNQNGKIELSPIDIPAAYRLSKIQSAGNGQLLMNAYDFKTHRPLVFRVDKNGQVLENIRPDIPAGFRGYCTNIAADDGQLAMSGYYHNGSRDIHWFKTGNDAFELEQPEGAMVTVNRTLWIRK